MNLNVSGHQFNVTPAIRKYVNSKLGRVIRHFDHVIDAHVILSVKKPFQPDTRPYVDPLFLCRGPRYAHRRFLQQLCFRALDDQCYRDEPAGRFR